jgi:rubrerythrin
MSTETTAAKPTYLGLLNAITLAERNAGVYLRAWAAATTDPELRRALDLVAARETTHGEVFRQRIERLGHAVREDEDAELAERIRVYGDPGVSDLEKIQAARRRNPPGKAEAFFASIDERASDESVDALTRDTLRWFVHEERDSRALLLSVYDRIDREGATGPRS